ncbi:uncharacterized protein ARMOST_10841 [Armillaria ostoyae]|uniref:VPS37 C-terminal domain-containing protein n=1 Tax=Armillaria ostoyae TaxID=47428 RepID=A0A284RFF6_ARMOS|nr:uncharacterized protein ARMOST_10841 [Armillaria ostoyae]
MSNSQSPSITHIPVPLASTAGIGGIPTPAHDIPVGLQLPSSNPAPATHPTFLSDTGVAQPPVAAPHSAVPRTPLMDATSKDQKSFPRPGANQYNDDASPLSGIIAFGGFPIHYSYYNAQQPSCCQHQRDVRRIQGSGKGWRSLKEQKDVYQRFTPQFLLMRLRHATTAQDDASEALASTFVQQQRPIPSGVSSGTGTPNGRNIEDFVT